MSGDDPYEGRNPHFDVRDGNVEESLVNRSRIYEVAVNFARGLYGMAFVGGQDASVTDAGLRLAQTQANLNIISQNRQLMAQGLPLLNVPFPGALPQELLHLCPNPPSFGSEGNIEKGSFSYGKAALWATAAFFLVGIAIDQKQKENAKEKLQEQIQEQNKKIDDNNKRLFEEQKKQRKEELTAYFKRPFSHFFGAQVEGALCRDFSSTSLACSEPKNLGFIGDNEIKGKNIWVNIESRAKGIGDPILSLTTHASYGGAYKDKLVSGNVLSYSTAGDFNIDGVSPAMRNIIVDRLNRYGFTINMIRNCKTRPDFSVTRINGYRISCNVTLRSSPERGRAGLYVSIDSPEP